MQRWLVQYREPLQATSPIEEAGPANHSAALAGQTAPRTEFPPPKSLVPLVGAFGKLKRDWFSRSVLVPNQVKLTCNLV